MTTAAEKRKAEAQAKEAEAAQTDSSTEKVDVDKVIEESQDQPKHIGSDSNIDHGRRDDAIEQPTANRTGESLTQDALGTDRIVPTGVQDAWRPAPVEPDEDAVKKAEERNAKLEAERKAYRDNQIDPVSGRLNKDVEKGQN